jgi:outer membrane lipoprotein-sorting protein
MLKLKYALVALVLLCAGAAGAAEPTPAALLAGADAIRNPPGSFSVQIRLADYRDNALNATSTLLVYARPTADAGYQNIVHFSEPARDNGKLLLRNGVDLWFYDPSSQSTIRISPQARLLGQASNGDVMSTSLGSDYRGTIVGAETIADADQVSRHCTRLRLTAVRSDVTYPFVDYWIETGTNRPVKALYYTAENRLLKTAYFRRYESVLGADRPTETVIVDGLNPSWITVLRLSNYASRDLPESWFQRSSLRRFSGNE